MFLRAIRLPQFPTLRLPVYLLGLITLASSGCVVGPDYHRPATPVPDVWHQQLENGVYTDANELRQWWTVFNDPMLNELVTVAGEQNLDLYAAATRICQARAQFDIARSARLAYVDGISSYSRSLQSRNALGLGGGVPTFFLDPRSRWLLGYDISWEPDLFGRISRQIESANAQTGATVESYRDILVALYADVVQNYVLARTLQARLEYAHKNVEIQADSLDLATKRLEGGVAPVLDKHQAEANLANTEAEIPPLDAQLQQTLNRIAVLLGEYPGSVHDLLMSPSPIPQPPEALPMMLPCDVIRQRPDIRQAERQLAAATAEIGVAISDLYPRFSLGGTFSLQTESLKNLFEDGSYSFNVGPGLRWAINHAGQILANVCAKECATEEALANYQQTILRAVEEVENAVAAYNHELRRREALRRSVKAAEQSLERVLDLYREGQVDFLNVLDTQRTLFTAQNLLVASEGQVILNLVSIYRALGGGWDPNHHCHLRRPGLHCPDERLPLYEYKPAGVPDSADADAERKMDDGDDKGSDEDVDKDADADADDPDMDLELDDKDFDPDANLETRRPVVPADQAATPSRSLVVPAIPGTLSPSDLARP
ncbi:MAG: efflux transporter outer membrane subunit [Planctomycetales bacterium]|nr:efflux transporter outer membrane subunit [Planctomycetales bacterium]